VCALAADHPEAAASRPSVGLSRGLLSRTGAASECDGRLRLPYSGPPPAMWVGPPGGKRAGRAGGGHRPGARHGARACFPWSRVAWEAAGTSRELRSPRVSAPAPDARPRPTGPTTGPAGGAASGPVTVSIIPLCAEVSGAMKEVRCPNCTEHAGREA